MTPLRHRPAPSRPPTSAARTILEAAERVFAARGLHGTPTIEIAKAAGISQAYLFRLFPTKAELFIALVRALQRRASTRTFVDAAAEAKAAGEDVLAGDGPRLRRPARRPRTCCSSSCTRTPPATTPRSATRCARASRASSSSSSASRAPTPRRSALLRPRDAAQRPRAMGAEDVDEHWAKVLLGPKHRRLQLSPLFFCLR